MSTPPTKKCPQCDAPNAGDATSCWSCKAVFGGPGRIPQPGPPQRPGSAGKWISALLVVVLLAVGGYAGWTYWQSFLTPEQVVTGYYNAMQSGDAETAKTYLCAKDLENPAAMKLMAQSAAVAKSGKLPKRDFAIEGTALTGPDEDGALVSYVIKAPAGSSDTSMFRSTFVLLREGGRWKIDDEATTRETLMAIERSRPKPRRMPSTSG